MRAMDARGSILMAASLLLAMGALASPGIYRCTGPGGRVTYQEIPCPNDSAQRATDIPTEYPEVNREARERLFQREAALEARQLEREKMDTALRIAREERLAREAEAKQLAPADATPFYLVAQPLRFHPLPPRFRMHGQPHRPRTHDRPL